MSQTRILIAAAFLGLLAGNAYAQNPPNPLPGQAAPQQGAGPGMMGNAPMMGRGGTMGEQAEKERGIIGIFPALSADAIGAPARLTVRDVAPYSPAYFAGIESGDQIAAVDGQPLDGKSLDDVVKAIRGEVGTTVKLRLNRGQGQSREVSLTRVAPVSEHMEHHMSEHGGMERGEMMMHR